MLPNEELQNLLVTLNQRYLIEKDIEGNVKEMLDLRCLLSYKVQYSDLFLVVNRNFEFIFLSDDVCMYMYMFYNKNECMYMYIKLLLCGGNVQCYI